MLLLLSVYPSMSFFRSFCSCCACSGLWLIHYFVLFVGLRFLCCFPWFIIAFVLSGRSLYLFLSFVRSSAHFFLTLTLGGSQARSVDNPTNPDFWRIAISKSMLCGKVLKT